MKKIWFRRAGWFHIPASLPGALIAAATLAFCAQVFVAIDGKSHSVSDTLYGVFPFIGCVFLLLDWIASRTAGDAGDYDPD